MPVPRGERDVENLLVQRHCPGTDEFVMECLHQHFSLDLCFLKIQMLQSTIQSFADAGAKRWEKLAMRAQKSEGELPHAARNMHRLVGSPMPAGYLPPIRT